MKQKNGDGSSEGDRTFDFKYKIDISDRKGKTGQTFKHQSGFQFDDFKDFKQDKTLKSQILSQKKWLPSELVKRSQQSLYITQNPTQLSIKKKGGSFIAQNILKIQNSSNAEQQQVPSNYTSPKFNDQKYYKSVSNDFYGKKQFNITQTQRITPSKQFQNSDRMLHSNNILSKNTNEAKAPNTFSSRQKNDVLSIRLSPQMQYKDLICSIQFYQSENQRIQYQTSKLLSQIVKYQSILGNNHSYERQLQKITQQTYSLNTQISNQRSIQRKLQQDYRNIEQQFDQIVVSVENFRFQRPQVIKDQTKAIIDQINSLRAEFDSLRRDQGSLNLSNTLQNPTGGNLPSIQSRIPFNSRQVQNKKMFNPEQMLMKQYITQIVQNCKIQPNYIYNIKMMIVRDEWKIFQNSQICINYCSRDYPLTEFRIGNKTAKTLTSFTFKQGAAVIADNQILQSKSYYIHHLKMVKITQPFVKMQIKYRVSLNQNNQNMLNSAQGKEERNYTFFLPTLPLKHGQFIPITKKQYQKQSSLHENTLQQIVALQRHLDTSIIKNDLTELLLFFPNLLVQRNQRGEEVCKGIFKLWNTNQGSLVKIVKKESTISLYIKNNFPFLLQSLQFLLTSIF